MTQSEPNGEENKQPEAGNYYRHYNNLSEYADSYVDDFIKYRPELDGVETVEDFARIMSETNYFTSNVETYIAGMKRGGYPQTSEQVSLDKKNLQRRFLI